MDTEVPIIWDQVKTPSKDPQQRWRVLVRLLEDAASESKPFVCWTQDDALVCRDFTAAVDNALTAAGSPILLSPYTGTGRPDQQNIRRAVYATRLKGEHWLTTRSLNWGVAVVFPTQYVETVIREGSKGVYSHSPSDYRVGVTLRDRVGLRTYYTHPSLAQHRDVRSLVGNGTGVQRVAHEFLGADVSGTTVDFSVLPQGCVRSDGTLDPYLTKVHPQSGRATPSARTRRPRHSNRTFV